MIVSLFASIFLSFLSHKIKKAMGFARPWPFRNLSKLFSTGYLRRMGGGYGYEGKEGRDPEGGYQAHSSQSVFLPHRPSFSASQKQDGAGSSRHANDAADCSAALFSISKTRCSSVSSFFSPENTFHPPLYPLPLREGERGGVIFIILCDGIPS